MDHPRAFKALVEKIGPEGMELVAKTIEEIDLPIDIKHWLGTKREVSKQTALALARWFRDEEEEE